MLLDFNPNTQPSVESWPDLAAKSKTKKAAGKRPVKQPPPQLEINMIEEDDNAGQEMEENMYPRPPGVPSDEEAEEEQQGMGRDYGPEGRYNRTSSMPLGIYDLDHNDFAREQYLKLTEEIKLL